MAKRRKKRSKRSHNSVGILLMIIGAIAVIIALVGVGVFLYLNTETEVALNKEDLCPEQGARGTVAFLLDTTDELAPVTKAEIKEKILVTQQSIPRFYRLSVYTLSESGLTIQPVASICNPGRLDQMDKLAQDGLTANPVMIERKYGEFRDKNFSSVNNVFEQEFEGSQSPLLSSLQELSVVIPSPVDIESEMYPAGRNKIVFVTDFLEHTEIFSIYRNGLDFEAFRNSRAKEKFGKSYRNLDIEVLLVRRNIKNFSTMDLAQFWARVFKQEFNSDFISMKLLSGEI